LFCNIAIKIGEKMTSKKYEVSGMSCHHCVMAVEKEISKLNLTEKKVEIGSVEVKYDGNKINESQIIQAIEEAGYKVIH